MLYAYLFSKACQGYPSPRKGSLRGRRPLNALPWGPIRANSTLLAEGEGGTATSLGQRRSSGGKKSNPKPGIIHRVPSVEGGTATSLGSFSVARNLKICKEIFEKALQLSYLFVLTTKPGGSMERNSYVTYTVGKGKEYPFGFKRDAVMAAKELGIKPAAKRFKVARNTMRSWVNRFDARGNQGLFGMRKGPKHIPNKISPDLEERIVSIRRNYPCFGPLRIKYHFEIPASLGAIRRVIKSHKLVRKRRKVYQKKRDMRAVKAKRPTMAHMQMDVKHLYDIPNYWEQIKDLGLPRFQYTVRETKTGMLFLGYSNELSELNARMMIDSVLNKMKEFCPLEFSQVTVQTDNGTEFSGLARTVDKAPFVHLIEKIHGANHTFIRPGHCNANADVESSHALIEEEFFDLARFRNREDFFRQAETYRLYFNFRRPNFYKGIKTPVEICTSDWGPKVSLKYSLINTLDLDKISVFSYQRGQTIPDLPDYLKKSKENF